MGSIKLFTTILLFIATTINSSSKRYYKKQCNQKQIEIGEMVPDFPIRNFMDYTGKTSKNFGANYKLSDFEGKLIILDFWTTNCSSCIDGFPKLSKLQALFGDKIQIFLVNNIEDSSRIQRWIKNRSGQIKDKNILPKNLPIIFSSPEFNKYFPLISEIGFNVWIGKDRRFVLRGISQNTHEKKIRQYLSGEKIDFLSDVPWGIYNKYEPFFKSKNSENVKRSSILASFNREFASPYEYAAECIIDSNSQTIRNTYLNTSIENLYIAAHKYWFNHIDSIISKNVPILNLMDKSIVSLDPLVTGQKVTDESMVKACYVYEQILPINSGDSLCNFEMALDLNSYFSNALGISGNIKDTICNYYKIIISDSTKLILSNKNESIDFVRTNDGTKFIIYGGFSLKYIITTYISQLRASVFRSEPIVFNTKSDGRFMVKLLSPNQINSIEEFNSELSKNGLSIVKMHGRLPRLIIEHY